MQLSEKVRCSGASWHNGIFFFFYKNAKVRFDIHALLSFPSSFMSISTPLIPPFIPFSTLPVFPHFSLYPPASLTFYFSPSCSTFSIYLVFALPLIFCLFFPALSHSAPSLSVFRLVSSAGPSCILGMPATYGPHSSQSAERPTAPHRWPYIDWPGAESSKAWPSPKWP